MRTFLIFIVLSLLAIIAGGFALPREVTVERELVIQRPVSTVFTVLNSFQSFERWSAWKGLDPGVEFEQSGPAAGVGARLEWSGDPARLGTGWQEIVVSEPMRRIDIKLHSGPQGDADTSFMVSGDQLASRVRWQFKTDVTAGQGLFDGLLGRYFGLFLSRWVGKDMDQGLEGLRRYLEQLPAADFSDADIELLNAPLIEVARVSGNSGADPDAVAAALATGFQEISDWALTTGAVLGGQPMAITRSTDGAVIAYEAAIPLEGLPRLPAPEPARVTTGFSPAGPAVRIVHRGALSDTLASYQQAEAWAAAHGHQLAQTSWEHYISDPADTPPEAMETHIYLMLDELPPGTGTSVD